VEDISDLAYCNRHRKYELAEKRIKNRENEVLQYYLYKMQELEEKMRYMEINNLIPLQNEIINNTLDSTSSNGSNISNKKNIDTDYIKGNKEVLKKIKKHSKCEKSKSCVKKTSKENSVHHRKQHVDENEEKIKENVIEKVPENVNRKNEIKKDNDLQIIGIVNVVETEYEKLLKNKSRFNAAIEKLLSCRINPYPDETHKLRRCSRKLKAFGVPLPHSLNKQIIFDNVIIKQRRYSSSSTELNFCTQSLITLFICSKISSGLMPLNTKSSIFCSLFSGRFISSIYKDISLNKIKNNLLYGYINLLLLCPKIDSYIQ